MRGDSVEVLAEKRGGLGDRENLGLFGLADPGRQQLASAVADEVSGGPGEVAGPRCVRAREAGLVEVLDLLGAEALAVVLMGSPSQTVRDLWVRTIPTRGRHADGYPVLSEEFRGLVHAVDGQCRTELA
ncbi:hypothetical protein ACF05T_26645 [Streptomyces lateritius]|uniref:Uncharacterized protein n=1 Tax=Streptomyces lateritius TaxID=67313 RepID=A0ABW6YIF9_9ACTN